MSVFDIVRVHTGVSFKSCHTPRNRTSSRVALRVFIYLTSLGGPLASPIAVEFGNILISDTKLTLGVGVGNGLSLGAGGGTRTS